MTAPWCPTPPTGPNPSLAGCARFSSRAFPIYMAPGISRSTIYRIRDNQAEAEAALAWWAAADKEAAPVRERPKSREETPKVGYSTATRSPCCTASTGNWYAKFQWNQCTIIPSSLPH